MSRTQFYPKLIGDLYKMQFVAPFSFHFQQENDEMLPPFLQ